MGYVYFIRQAEDEIFKIGMTNRTPKSRLDQLQVTSPFELNIFGFIKAINARKVERQLHKKFRDYRLNGEWFNLSEQQVEHVLKEFDGEKLNPDFIEISTGKGKFFFYQISTEKLFVALQTFRNCFGDIYALSHLTWSSLVSVDGQLAVDYDVLFDDFKSSSQELIDHKETLINRARMELAL